MALAASQLRILLALVPGESHGYAIMMSVRETGEKLGPAALYAGLSKLADAGLVEELTDRPRSARGRDTRRRYYRITPSGRAAVVVELDRMHATLERAALLGIDRRAWRPSGPTAQE